MPYNEIKKLLGLNCVPLAYVSDLQNIYREEDYKDALYLMALAFMYGKIIGKREDRARRKRG